MLFDKFVKVTRSLQDGNSDYKDFEQARSEMAGLCVKADEVFEKDLAKIIGLINPNRSGGVSRFELERAYTLLVEIEESIKQIKGYAKEGGPG